MNLCILFMSVEMSWNSGLSMLFLFSLLNHVTFLISLRYLRGRMLVSMCNDVVGEDLKAPVAILSAVDWITSSLLSCEVGTELYTVLAYSNLLLMNDL